MQIRTDFLVHPRSSSHCSPRLVSRRGDQLLGFAAGDPSDDDYPAILGPDGEPWLLTVAQVAALMGLSRSRVYELLHDGLPSISLGRSRRIPVAPFRRWLIAQGGE